MGSTLHGILIVTAGSLLCGGGCSSTPAHVGPPDMALSELSDDGWMRIGLQDWSLAAGTEDVIFRDFHLARDLQVSAIRAMDPPGTHHVVLLDPGRLGPGIGNSLFVGVVGTGEFRFPPGVRLELRAADTLETQIHLLHAGTGILSGTSGIEVLADAPLEGPIMQTNILNAAVQWFELKPHRTTTLRGQCTLDHDQTLIAIAPHMHTLGIHQRATLEHDGGSEVLFDGDFRFSEQRYQPLDSIAGHAGDVIHFECTWNNTTDAAVPSGNDASDEMCLAQIYRYPAGNSDYCTQ